MRYLRNRFIAGLLIITPTAVTFWVLWKIFHSIDNLLRPFEHRYPIVDFPGVGFAVVILLVLILGILAGNFIGNRVITLGERVVSRVPLIRRIYTATKELAEVFLSDRRMVFREVVLIPYPHPGTYALAFVTRTTPDDIRTAVGRDLVNVFVPTTPNPTSGFLILVPKEDVVPVSIGVEEGMKMVISGGAYVPPQLEDSGAAEPGA